MKKILLIASIILLCASNAFAFSGAGSIWYQAKGAFVPVNVPGDSTGFGKARDVCIARGGGLIQLGPGCENIITTYPLNANLTVIKAYITGWAITPNISPGSTGAGYVEAHKPGTDIRYYPGDQAGIVSAFAYVGAGGKVKVGPGRYSITSTLVVPHSAITLEGSGDSTVFSLEVIDTLLTVASGAHGVKLSNFTIDGRNQHILGGVGIGVYDADRVEIQGVTFLHLYQFGLISGTGCEGLEVRECIFRGIGAATTTTGSAVSLSGSYPKFKSNSIDSTTGFGIMLQGADHYEIDGNTITNTPWRAGTHSVSPVNDQFGGSIYVDTLSIIGTIRNNYIINYYWPGHNHINANGDSTLVQGNYIAGGGSAIHMGYNQTGGRGSSILGNQIHSPRHSGIFVEPISQSIDGLTVSGNTIFLNGITNYGIDIESNGGAGIDATNLNVTNNTIHDPLSAGIELRCLTTSGFRNATVTGNTIIKSRNKGIDLDAVGGGGAISPVLNLTIAGNHIISAVGAPIYLDNFNGPNTASITGNVATSSPTPDFIGTGWTISGIKSTIRASIVAVYDSLNVTGATKVWGATTLIGGVSGVFDVNDSLRVNGVANFDQGIQTTGNSWIAGRWSVGDSLRINKVANFDQGVQATGNSWVSGKLAVKDSIRTNQRIISDVGYQVTGDSWISGKFAVKDSIRASQRIIGDVGYQITGNSWVAGALQVRDSTRTLLALVSDSLRARKILVQDSMRVNNGIDVSSGNISIKFGNSYQIRDTGGTPRAIATTNSNNDLILNPLAGGGRTTMQAFAGTVGVSANSTGDVYIGSGLSVTDSATVAGPLVATTKATVRDSLTLNGVLNIGVKSGIPSFHNIGNGGTTASDTVTVSLHATDDAAGGLLSRSPKIEFKRNNVTVAQLAAYAGGLQLLTTSTNRLGFGVLGGGTGITATINGAGNADFNGVSAESVTASSNIAPAGYLTLATGKALVGTGTAFVSMANTGSYKLKDTGGAERSVLHTAGGTNILRISPVATGQSIDFLNFAGANANLTVQDAGVVVFRSFVQASLPTIINGGMVYCSDCTKANPCVGGGTGSLAFGVNGAWECNH